MSDLKELGVALKAYRIAIGETADELAGALEISLETVEKLEAGLQKPDKSTIELLARHFNLKDQEAKRLMKLSGYEKAEFEFDLDAADIQIEDLTKDFDVMIAPIFYTDMVNVVSNQYGVTINFIQHMSKDGKPVVVSRVGMSHKHAASIVKVLQETLKRADQTQSPESSSDSIQN